MPLEVYTKSGIHPQTFLENGYILFDYKFLVKPKENDPLLPENWSFWGGYEVEFKIIKEYVSTSIKKANRDNILRK
ncbi:MAG: hypothetical protein H6Q69_3047 [Firmicutes bacterium]|nr:hypothetical protein [Bacillota bacterium]